MNNEEYWSRRALERMAFSEELALESMPQILRLYEEALKNIDKDIQSIYSNYAKNGILELSDLKVALTPTEQKRFLKSLEKQMFILGLNPEDVFDTRYLSRLTRLEALKEQIQMQIYAIAPQEMGLNQELYSEILKEGYKSIQSDFKVLGISPTFTTLNKKIVDEILRSQWVGRNYSKSIWKNVDKFARTLPELIGGPIAIGQSAQKTARLVKERFEVSTFNATRLVRTETNYFHGQAELQSYIDDGVQEYEYDARIDSRTSKICRKLDGKRFKVYDAKPGVNYHPMHAHCRSTSQAVISSIKPIKDDQDRTKRLLIGPTNKQVMDQYRNKIRDSHQ